MCSLDYFAGGGGAVEGSSPEELAPAEEMDMWLMVLDHQNHKTRERLDVSKHWREHIEYHPKSPFRRYLKTVGEFVRCSFVVEAKWTS